jgi:hypothetical protein
MKKLAIIFSLLAVCGFMLCVCGDDNGGGPHCEDPPATCEPDCTLPEVCCGTTCMNETCTPACATDGTEVCNPCDGTCVKLCLDPVCTATQWCDDGTCKDLPDPPVCDPECVAPQVCVE